VRFVAYDYSKLLGRIIEKYGSQAKFSGAMGLSERSLSLKLNSKVGFKQSEIAKACKLLDIAESDIPEYFFTLKVQ
jgi:DNA-binding Xre family transcriptional regulator